MTGHREMEHVWVNPGSVSSSQSAEGLRLPSGAQQAQATRRTWVRRRPPPAGGSSAPSGESRGEQRGTAQKDGSATGHPGKGHGGQVSAVEPRVTAKAPHVSLANTVGYVVILPSERPFTQDRSVLGKDTLNILTHISSTQKKETSILSLDSAFILYPSMSLISASCLSIIGSAVCPLPPISHSFRDHWLMALSVRLGYSSSCMRHLPLLL